MTQERLPSHLLETTNMKKSILYLSISLLLSVSCNKALEKSEVEKGFTPKGAVPTASISADIEVDEYEQSAVVNVTFSGVTEDMKGLELGVISSTDPGFVESNTTLIDSPADGTYQVEVKVSAGKTNYIKAVAANLDGASYSDRLTINVPDIPWQYKIASEYVGNFAPDKPNSSKSTFENHVIKVEVADDFSTVTLYDIDPYVKENYEGYESGKVNFVTGNLDLEARTITLTAGNMGVDISASPWSIAGVESYEDDKYSISQEFVITFNEDATTMTLPYYMVIDSEQQTVPMAYSENGTTLTAN